MADLAVQARDLGLDVLGRADVGADRPRLLGELVEQGGVDVVADAEGEDARVGACSSRATFFRILSGLVSPMVGWPSVKKTTVKGRPASSVRMLEGRGEGAADGGAAGGLEAVDPLRRGCRGGPCSPATSLSRYVCDAWSRS